MNKIILIGRVGQDAETINPSGTSITNFSMATSEKYKNRNGEKVEETEWHNIKLIGKLSESLGQYIKKGALIAVTGKKQTESWEKDGEKKYKVVILGKEVQLLGSLSSTNDSSSASNTRDDLPF